MHQIVDSPPPPAPANRPDSFQTTSPVRSILVPPTPTTNGWLAGSPADSIGDTPPPMVRQPVDPLSPEAASTVCPCAAASSKIACSNLASVVVIAASQTPQEVEITWSRLASTMALSRSSTLRKLLFGAR